MKRSKNSLAEMRMVPRKDLPPLLSNRPHGKRESDHILDSIKASERSGDVVEAKKLHRILRSSFRSFKSSQDKETYYRVYDESETREMGIADKIRWWFYYDVLSPYEKNIFIYMDTGHKIKNYHNWLTYYYKKIEKDRQYVSKIKGNPIDHSISFTRFCEHVKSNGVAYGIFANHFTSYIAFDIDNHSREDDLESIEKICSIYEILRQLKGGLVFIEAKHDFTGFHLVFLFHKKQNQSKAMEIAQAILKNSGVQLNEIYPSATKGFRIPFHNQYHIVLDKIVEKKKLQYIYELRHGKNYNLEAPIIFDYSIYPSVETIRYYLNSILSKVSLSPTVSGKKQKNKAKAIEIQSTDEKQLDPEDEKLSFSDGKYLPTIINYFSGNLRGIEGMRWKFFFHTAKIALVQEYSDQKIVEGIDNLMNSLPEDAKKGRSWFALTTKEHEIHIKKAIKEAKINIEKMKKENSYDGFEKIIKENLVTFRIFDKSTWGTFKNQGKIDTLLFLSSKETISDEYSSEITEKLKNLKIKEKIKNKKGQIRTVEKPVIPKRLHCDLVDLAISMAKLCGQKYYEGFGVSIKYFRMMLQDKFQWKPRGDIAIYELLNVLNKLEVIEITGSKCKAHKSRAFKMGKRMKEEIGNQILEKYNLDLEKENLDNFYYSKDVKGKIPIIESHMPD